MSSMFKKKGGLAFKPKIPSARPRAPAPAAAATKPVEGRPSIDADVEASPGDAGETPETNPQAPPQAPSQAPAQATLEPPLEAPQPGTHPVADGQEQSPSEAPEQSSCPPKEPAEPAASAESPVQTPLPPQSGLGAAVVEARERLSPAAEEGEALEVDPRLETTDSRSGTAAQLPTPLPITQQQPPPVEHHAVEAQSEEPIAIIPEVVPGAEAQPDGSGPTPPAATPASTPASKPASKPARKQTSKSKTSATTTTVGEPDGDGNAPAPAKAKKRQRNGSQQDGEPTARKARKRQASASTSDGSETKPRPRRARSPTPEDAENQQVDLQQLRMADLTKDLRIGKKFSRHDELRERERQARLKTKLGRDGDQADGTESGSASPMVEDGTKRSATPGGSTTPAAVAPAGPQFRIVDGQIVVDQSSLVLDRHARAAAARGGEDMEAIEENDFTRLITSSSFMNTSKLKGPNIWTEEETELFYRGLRMFGTEFEMISKMFPGKQRRHVKLKFNREERQNPKRIDAALIGEKTIKMDIDEYRAFTGAQYESVETIEAEQRKIQDEYEAERQRIADEQAEEMRKKREELFADDGDETGGKKKKGKKKGKQAVAYGLNGEPIMQES